MSNEERTEINQRRPATGAVCFQCGETAKCWRTQFMADSIELVPCCGTHFPVNE